MLQNWLEFWQSKNSFDEKMQDNFSCFLSKIGKYITLSKELTVLDWGSGPGYIADAWHNKVKEIHGADVSERYNAIASAKHSKHHNVFFHHIDPDDYLNVKMLPVVKFDLVVVMSVLQYYRNKEEVKQLLKNLLLHTAPNGTILLVDFIVQNGL
jgi:2-polyprenyl-3-methyl-5-hydroxy-6-metoxy-1,4-benzoquinol methylase